MRNLLYSLILLFFPFPILAQIEDLLKDKDISYVATYETAVDLRFANRQDKSQIQPLKLVTKGFDCQNFGSENWVAAWLLEGMKTGVYNAFDDADFKYKVGQSILKSRIETVDIITTFDPDTYQEKTVSVKNEIKQQEIKSFNSKQAIYFNKKTGIFKTRLLAIAPMLNKRDNTGNIIGTEPLAWLQMNLGNIDVLNLQSPDIIWSALLLNSDNPLNTDNLKVIKNETGKIFTELVFDEAKNGKHIVESTERYGCSEQLTQDLLGQIFSPADTIITFDPTTSEQKMMVVKNYNNPTDAKMMVLAQEWYFDDKKKQLACRLKSISPQINRVDENGNFLYSKLLFYLHFN